MKLKYYKYMRIYEGYRINQGRGQGRGEGSEEKKRKKRGREVRRRGFK